MSLVELRVELPAYAHSFVIQVRQTCTIVDVKQEIYKSCLGGPRVDGQRIIWRGRYLADHERVEELWKSIDEPRVIHLAVHPSAWSSPPPEIPPSIQAASPLPTVPQSLHQNSGPPPPVNPTAHPLAYILLTHQRALSVLCDSIPTYLDYGRDLDTLRSISFHAVENHGWSWPAILDAEFPAPTDGGLKYDRVVIDGQSYLLLCNPSEMPTALQTHALKVLTYTFTLLSIPVSNVDTPHTIASQSVPIPPDVNLLLQQLGLPQIRVAHNQNQNPNPNPILPVLREMPLRPLLAPLTMLLFRTLLLLYFVAPARKPIFGILILAWVLYEIWRPIRNGLIRGWRQADNQNQNPPDQQAAQNLAAELPRPQANIPGDVAGANNIDHAAIILDTVANQNISIEEQVLNEVSGANTAEPGFGHKLVTLLGLLITTMHPAVWNRRRVALRQREGRIRTEANIRDAPTGNTEGEDAQNQNREQLRTELRTQYARRPRWVREYMERVVTADWVDDSD